jgi:hypothetical protein
VRREACLLPWVLPFAWALTVGVAELRSSLPITGRPPPLTEGSDPACQHPSYGLSILRFPFD